MKHIELLRSEDHRGHSCCDILEVDGKNRTYLGEITCFDDAEFIVKACNSYYEHIKLLTLFAYTGDYENRPSSIEVVERAREAIEAIEAAE